MNISIESANNFNLRSDKPTARPAQHRNETRQAQ